MWEDPIVAEVHRTREKLAAQHNFDVGAFFADLRNGQTALEERLVLQKKKPTQRLKLTRAAAPVLRSSLPPEDPATWTPR